MPLPPSRDGCLEEYPCTCWIVSILAVIIFFAYMGVPAIAKTSFPKPAAPVFAVTSLSLSNYALNVRFNITNPNEKASIFYHGLVFSLNHNGLILSGAQAKSFGQRGGNATIVDVRFPGIDELLVAGAGSSGRVLNFGLTGEAGVVFRDGNLRGKGGKIEVRCDNVGLVVAADGSSGKLAGIGDGGALECWVNCSGCHLIPLALDRMIPIS